MQTFNTFSLAPAVNNWLANSRQPRILHFFDRACNLINERREVLSIVTPQIGDGPFNLVVEDDVCFSRHLSLQSPISNSPNHLVLENLTIRTADAKLWSPRPNWEMLHARREDIHDRLTELPITNYREASPWDQFSNSPVSSLQFSNSLLSSLATADIPSSLTATRQLAGLGIGLTPSGDDFLLGAIYAAWIIHPPEIAFALARGIAETAAPLTTSLSAAWLRAAGKGEAGEMWHDFFDALVSGNIPAIQEPMQKILGVGETSGADAMSGFIGVFMAFTEKELAAHEDPSR